MAVVILTKVKLIILGKKTYNNIMGRAFIIFIVIFQPILTKAQVGLKWFTLGEKSNRGSEITTLGGISGCLSAAKLSNGRVFLIEFKTSRNCKNDGYRLVTVQKPDREFIRETLEEKFIIQFEIISMIKGSDHQWKATKDGISFYIREKNEPDYSEEFNMPLRITIIDDKLKERYNNELLKKKKDDF
jgi:hypothetical protein